MAVRSSISPRERSLAPAAVDGFAHGYSVGAQLADDFDRIAVSAVTQDFEAPCIAIAAAQSAQRLGAKRDRDRWSARRSRPRQSRRRHMPAGGLCAIPAGCMRRRRARSRSRGLGRAGGACTVAAAGAAAFGRGAARMRCRRAFVAASSTVSATAIDDDAVSSTRMFDRAKAVEHVVQHLFSRPLQRIADSRHRRARRTRERRPPRREGRRTSPACA